MRANLDGSNVESIGVGSAADDFILDVNNGHVYCSWPDQGAIWQAGLSGENPRKVLDVAPDRPNALAIVLEPSSFLLAALGLLGLACYAWRQRRITT